MRKISVVLLPFILFNSVYAFNVFNPRQDHKKTSYNTTLLQKKHHFIDDEDFFGQWQGMCTNEDGTTETDSISIEWGYSDEISDEIKINGMFFGNNESINYTSSGKKELDSGHIKLSWDKTYNKLVIYGVSSVNEYDEKALEYFVNTDVAHYEKGQLIIEKEATVYVNDVRQETPFKSKCIYHRINSASEADKNK